MSAEDPVIAVSNGTSEPDRVYSETIPPSEHLTAKDVSTIPDSLSVEPLTEPPAETAQTASDDTLSHLLKHDANIPNSMPTNPNGSANGVEATTSVSVELLNFRFLLHYASEG